MGTCFSTSPGAKKYRHEDDDDSDDSRAHDVFRSRTSFRGGDDDDDSCDGREGGGSNISFAGDTLLKHVDFSSLKDRLLPEDETPESLEVFCLAQLRSKGVYATLLSKGCKEPDVLEKLTTTLRGIAAVSNLPDEIIRALAELMVLVRVPAGSVLVETGDIFSLIYVVSTGVLERGQETGVSKASRLSHVARLSLIKEMSGPWEVVGPVAPNLIGGRSPCNLFARVDSEIWVIEREAVLNVCANYTRQRSDKLLHYLNKVPLLNVLTEGERERVAGAMEMASFEDGERVFSMGDEGDAMYLIVEGRVECITPLESGDHGDTDASAGTSTRDSHPLDERGTASISSSEEKDFVGERRFLGEGQVFGELSLLSGGGKRSGTCIARAGPAEVVEVENSHTTEGGKDNSSGGGENGASPKPPPLSNRVRCMRLTKVDFDMLMGPLADYIADTTVREAGTGGYIVRVLRETPGLQNLPYDVTEAIAQRAKRFLVPPNTVFGLTNPAESVPNTPTHDEDMQSLKVFYGDFRNSELRRLTAKSCVGEAPSIESLIDDVGAGRGAAAAASDGADDDSAAYASCPDAAEDATKYDGGERDVGLRIVTAGSGADTNGKMPSDSEHASAHHKDSNSGSAPPVASSRGVAESAGSGGSCEATDVERDLVENKEVMPGLFIVSQGEAGVVIGKGVDVLLGHMSNYEHANDASQDTSSTPRAAHVSSADGAGRGSGGENLVRKSSSPRRRGSRRNTDFMRAQRERDIRDTLTQHSAASLNRGLHRGGVVRGHVIGLQHLLFSMRPTLMKSRGHVEYLFVPREVVEEYAVPLLDAFGLSQPSTATVSTFLNETPILNKLLQKDVQRVAPTVQRIFLKKGEVLAYRENKINTCYYVCSGHLAITDTDRGSNSSSSASGGGSAASTGDAASNETAPPPSTRKLSGKHGSGRRSILKNHPHHIFSSTSSMANKEKGRRKKSSVRSSFEGLIMFQGALREEMLSDATYTAASFTVLLALHRSKLEKRLGGSLRSVSDCDESEFRMRLLRSIPTLSGLADAEVKSMASAIRVKTFEPGTYIIVQGDSGEDAYIIRTGECVVTITVPSRSKSAAGGGKLGSLARGGDESGGIVTDYDGDEEEGNRVSNASLRSNSSIRSNDTSDDGTIHERSQLEIAAGDMASYGFNSGYSDETGSRSEGSEGKQQQRRRRRGFGRASSNGSGKDPSVNASPQSRAVVRRMSELQIARLSRGHFFGESALLEKKPRNANVVAKTTVECYVIPAKLFSKHLTPLSHDLKDRTSKNMQYREEKLKLYYTGSHFEKGMSMKDVDIVGYLGQGIVGQVVLVKTRIGEHYYAVKCINKSFVVKNEMAADVVAEMKLLKVCLFFCFLLC